MGVIVAGLFVALLLLLLVFAAMMLHQRRRSKDKPPAFLASDFEAENFGVVSHNYIIITVTYTL